jgi:protein-tyrosine phosphatase
MIDIHHHCLPAVDDGPREWAEALEMCAIAAEEGIETIVATPHVLRGRWPTFPPKELEQRIEELRQKSGQRPRLLLGSEYFFGHDMLEVLRSAKSIIPLAGSRYVLIELPANNIPPLFDQPLYRAQLEGWIPILAHPERNRVLQERPDLLASLIHHGLRAQITITSLTGGFGAGAQRAAETFLRCGLVHFVATDAHGATRRSPRIGPSVEALHELVGESVAGALMRENPRAVVENLPLPYVPEPLEQRSNGFLTRLRAFFTRRVS